MAEEKVKDEMLTHEGIYCGKEYRRSYQKDGKEIKIFGIKIKQTMEEQFAKSFTLFENTKGYKDEEGKVLFEEGDRIKLGYVVKEFTNKAGQESKSHTVLWIGKASDQTPQTTLTTPGTVKLDLSHFDEFKTAYLNAIKKQEKPFDMIHMVGSYIATYEAERVMELLKKCQEANNG